MDNAPLFSLTESEKEAVVAVVGNQRVGCVEDAILLYSYKRKFYQERPNINQLNKQLVEIRKYIDGLTDLLSDSKLRDYLLSISAECLSDQGGRHFIGEQSPFVNRTPMFHVLDKAELKKLDMVCEAAIKKQKPGPGKPKGQKDEAVHILLNSLCQCCEKANNGSLTTKKGNMLEQVILVLRKPLGFGEGERLPGLIRTIIEKRNSII